MCLPHPPEVLNEAGIRLAEETRTTLFRQWFTPDAAAPPGLSMTEVTVAAPALEWTAEDIRTATAEFAARVAGLGG